MNELFILVLCGFFGAIIAGIGETIPEVIAYPIYLWCAKNKVIHRLDPSVPLIEMKKFHWIGSFHAAALGYAPFFVFLVWIRNDLVSTLCFEMEFDVLNMIRILLFVYIMMYSHDFYFFCAHSLSHWSRYIYVNSHHEHHKYRGDITVYGTVYGTASDIFLLFSLFHILLISFLCYISGSVHVPNLLITLLIQTSTNMYGHCAYHCPKWFEVIISGGFLALPLSASSGFHYHHHISVRHNRALYSTIWDRIFGTYQMPICKICQKSVF